MKTTVIYHSADFDGIFCREIARKFLPDTELIGWDYGNPKLPFPDEGIVYVLDLSPECFTLTKDNLPTRADGGFNGNYFRLIWIDHHKSAIDKFPSYITGHCLDGVAACRLVWQWFYLKVNKGVSGSDETFIRNVQPCKQSFLDRTIQEPWAVRLAGEYDIWDKRDPDAELFQHGLRSRDISTWDWASLLSLPTKASIDEIERLISVGHSDILNPDGTNKNPTVVGLLESGRALQYARAKENESIIKKAGFTIEFEGLKMLACNHARYNSNLFTAGLTPEHEALFGFAYRDGWWAVSLYHAPGKEHHDLAAIAVKHGGGGHKGACGFRAKTLPFLQ